MIRITEEQVRVCLEPKVLVQVLEEAFEREYTRTITAPARTRMELASGVVFLTMPCHDSTLRALGVKIVSIADPVDGGGRVQAEYLLFDPSSRQPLASIAANYLTDVRTAAVSAIATRLLCNQGARVLGIFGTGRQALAHILVLKEVMPFSSILCCGSGTSKSRMFTERISREHGVDVHPASAEEIVRQSDVICTCTTSVRALFDGASIRPGTHLNLVGTFQSSATEVDEETIRCARVVVETYEGVLSEAGDILIPLTNGNITREHLAADLHELVSGKKVGRTRQDEITVFKSVGHAYEDLVTAKLVYEHWVGRTGTEFGW